LFSHIYYSLSVECAIYIYIYIYIFNKYCLVNELFPLAFFFFVHLGIIYILVLRFFSGMSGRVKTVYLFSLCVVSLLSSRFSASSLVWFYNFLKYLVFHSLISLSTVFICKSSRILWLLCTKVRSELIGESWIGA
jgi:hypothetical protein